MKKIFEGIMPALVTPFNADRKTVNEKVARQLIEFQLEQGADGFYILGSTGEGLLMTEDERKKMCEIAVSQVNHRKPVICHIAAMNFDETIRLAKHAEKAGVDAISAVPPVFFGYTNEEIYDYYKTLACSTGLPFIIYNHHAINGGMSAELVAKMFEIDNVTGVKWTVNNYYEMMRLKNMTHGEMNIINGPDEMLISGLAAGADAGIGTTYNVLLPNYINIYKCFKEGKMSEALNIQETTNNVVNCIGKYGCIPATKHMCEMLGFDVGDASLPMRKFDKKFNDAFEKALKEAGWIVQNGRTL